MCETKNQKYKFEKKIIIKVLGHVVEFQDQYLHLFPHFIPKDGGDVSYPVFSFSKEPSESTAFAFVSSAAHSGLDFLCFGCLCGNILDYLSRFHNILALHISSLS